MLDISILNKLKNIKVLLVEDDENTAIAIKQSLDFCCKEVVLCSNGIDGFEKFQNEYFDVIVSDINIPGISGLEMLKSIIKTAPHIKIIVITSYDSSENILQSLNLGAHSYLRKPFRIEELQTALLMATKNLTDILHINETFKYDFTSKTLYKNREIIDFTKYESNLFYLLINNANKIINYEIIENFVWQDKSMSSDALRVCIKKVRAKISPLKIENISGNGYKISINPTKG